MLSSHCWWMEEERPPSRVREPLYILTGLQKQAGMWRFLYMLELVEDLSPNQLHMIVSTHLNFSRMKWGSLWWPRGPKHDIAENTKIFQKTQPFTKHNSISESTTFHKTERHFGKHNNSQNTTFHKTQWHFTKHSHISQRLQKRRDNTSCLWLDRTQGPGNCSMSFPVCTLSVLARNLDRVWKDGWGHWNRKRIIYNRGHSYDLIIDILSTSWKRLKFLPTIHNFFRKRVVHRHVIVSVIFFKCCCVLWNVVFTKMLCFVKCHVFWNVIVFSP